MMPIARTIIVGVLILVAAGAGAWYALASPRAAETPAASISISAPLLPSASPKGTAKATRGLPEGVTIAFVDVAAKAGLSFTHHDGRTSMEYLMETTPPGLAWLDYDQDGLMDLFLVQGANFVTPQPSPAPGSKMFHNEGSGKFRDVTETLGVGHVGCGQGAAVGDYDNDGDPDLFITCYGKPDALYRNDAGRRFIEVADAVGLVPKRPADAPPRWSTCAAFLDYDNDGFLDLFTGSYVAVDLANYPLCQNLAHTHREVCPPRSFPSTRCSLFRNKGDGTFEDVSGTAGVDPPEAKALGVVAIDVDDDGLIDLFVANDGVPNFLFRNLGGGRFESSGVTSGCAVDGDGIPLAYMGVDADDLDGDGRPDLYVTAFAKQTDTLFRNMGGGQFVDATTRSGLSAPSRDPLSFGTCFLDPDHDGNLDIFVANGHVEPTIDEGGDPNITFRQRAQFYHNGGNGKFVDLSSQAGPYFRETHVGRGVGWADFDNDGNMDLAVGNSGEAPSLLHNQSKTPHHWVRLELRGTKSNRDAVGAKVTLRLAGGRQLVRHRKGGGSYLSASDPRLLVGLGEATRVESVEVRWPSGLKQRLGPLDADRGYLVVEGPSDVEPRP